MDNLKISNPNTINKTKTNEKYLIQSDQEEEQPSLDEVLKRNRELEEKIQQAREENLRLKAQLKQYKKEN